MYKNILVIVNMWKLENLNVIFYYQNGDATCKLDFFGNRLASKPNSLN